MNAEVRASLRGGDGRIHANSTPSVSVFFRFRRQDTGSIPRTMTENMKLATVNPIAANNANSMDIAIGTVIGSELAMATLITYIHRYRSHHRNPPCHNCRMPRLHSTRCMWCLLDQDAREPTRLLQVTSVELRHR
jgi:hypothetical protein